MQLSLTVLRCPDQVAPETRSVSGGEFHVGRGPDVDWILPDPDRLLSKRHFAVAFLSGGWQVADTSTNGTYMNTEADSIGRGTTRSLRDGDRLRLGAYEIEVRLVEQQAESNAPIGLGMGGGMGGGFGGGGGRSGPSPFGDPFSEDHFAPPPPPRRAFDEPEYSGMGMESGSAQLPHDYDPLAPDHDESAFGGGFRGPVQSDHSSSMDDAMIPPPIASYAAPHAGGTIPGDDLLPDDWDKDLLEGIGDPQPSAPQPTAPIAPPVASPGPAPRPPVAERAIPPQHVAPPIAPLPAADPFDFLDPLAPEAAPAHTAPVEALDFLDPLAPEAAPVRAAPPHTAPLDALDFLEPLAPAETPHAPPPFEPAPMPPAAVPFAPPPGLSAGAAPVVRQRPPRSATPPPPSPDVDPFDEPEPPVAQHTAPPMQSMAPRVEPAALSPFDEPGDHLEPQPIPVPIAAPAAVAPPPKVAPVPVPAPAVDNGAALDAFFQGAELSGATPTDPLAMMNGLGKAFRAVVSGLRAVLIARATIKGEFRIEQTMIRARGNNPLKFSANDDDALTALLGVGRRTDMAPAAAIEDSLRDLRLHEVAVMAAMQVAVRSMLDELSPDKVRAGAEQGGMLPAQRKARAWDAFEARHAKTVQALIDDFDSVFGKSFARAYERALDEISTRERQ